MSVVSGVKISALPPADAANDTDQLEVNQAGTSRRVTVGQLAAAVAAATLDVPEEFGAVGDWVTDDSDAIAAWLDYCTANGLKAVGTPGKTYRLADSFNGMIRTEFDGNGCEFLANNANATQPLPVFTIESMPEDIETVSMATVNTWTGLYRDSQKIAELADQQGWSYAFSLGTSESPSLRAQDVVIVRSTGAFDIPKGEAFEVVDKLGNLSKAIVGSYTMPFDGLGGFIAVRRRIRHPMVVKDLHVRLIDTPGYTYHRKMVILTQRPHTKMLGCVVRNETAYTVDRGFKQAYTTSLVYENCYAWGMDPTHAQPGNYGYAGEYCDNVVFRNCSEGECRRGLDTVNASNYAVDGGVWPDGIGGHWIEGLHVYGKAFLSCQHPTNQYPVLVSGSNVNIESAHIHMPLIADAAFQMRGDYPELTGIARLGPDVDITIDETGDPLLPTTQRIRTIMNFPVGVYDTLRNVALPSIIDCMPGMIRQVGGASDNFIALVVTPNVTAAQFPRTIRMPVEINIEPRAMVLAGSYAVTGGATPQRVLVFLYKSETSVDAVSGYSCRVRIDRIRRFLFNVGATAAAAALTTGRYDVEIRNVSDVESNINLTRGGVRRAVLERVNPSITFTTSGTALGDEDIVWDAIKTYTPTYTLTTNITTHTATPVHYHYTSIGQRRHVHVWGAVSVTPTAAANAPTNLGISLPFAGDLVSGSLAGTATTAAANFGASTLAIAGIAADATNDRAILQFLSNTTSAATFYYSFNYIL